MTLCELATAKHHMPPLECFPFASTLQAQDKEEIDEEAQASCVGALSRSAQFWSSYSGYLREVPQLCFAYRRWHDIDTSKSIYMNGTLEKLALIRLLKQREMRMATLVEEWGESILDFRTYSGNLRAKLTESEEYFRDIIVSMDSTALKFEKKLGEYFISAQKEHTTQLERQTSNFQSRLRETVEAVPHCSFESISWLMLHESTQDLCCKSCPR
ncbi:hypothetical protein JB92DRAFT_2841820 [Gautieria morchelliformis]|nr:hypothetical protein JB92DRAFT_2841820 [Gautieria morchelliformis]